MKHGGKMLVCVMGGLAFCTTAPAVPTDSSESSDNPYQSIVDRNVFSLKPPPPPIDPTETAKPTALKITLTGITTIFGDKRVLMKTAPPPGKPGEGPKSEQSYILTMGQREGDIEVLDIDEKTGTVKVDNAGTVQTLTFEKDGAKLPATAPPAGAPGAQPLGAPAIPGLPVTHPGPQAPGGGTTPNFQLPTRVPRLPTPGATSSTISPGAGGVGFSPGFAPSYGAPGFLPGNTATVGGLPGTTTTTPSQGASQLSAEEQALLIEAERQAGGANAALLPPTPLSPKLNQPAVQNPQTPTVTLPPLPGGRPFGP